MLTAKAILILLVLGVFITYGVLPLLGRLLWKDGNIAERWLAGCGVVGLFWLGVQFGIGIQWSLNYFGWGV
jgi:hypothetical protein